MLKLLRVLLVVSLLVVGVVPALAQGNGTVLAYGDSVLGEITSDVYEVFYTFEGSAGDTIVISMTKLQEGLDSYLDLFGPDGASLMTDDDSGGSLNSLLGPYTLPADGEYTIVATRFMRESGGSTGAFRLSLQLAELTSLTIGESVTAELSPDAPVAFFSYPGGTDAAYSLTGEGQGGDADFNLSVRDPQGNMVNSWYSGASDVALLDPLAMPQDGDYIIVLTRQEQGMPGSNPSGTVGVALTLREVETVPLTFGEAYSGILNDDNPSDHFAFDGARGDMLRLSGDVSEVMGVTYEVQIVAPTGYVFTSGSPAYYGPQEPQDEFVVDPIVLEDSGQFLVVVRRIGMSGPVGDEQVAYRFTLSSTETPELVAGEAVTGTFGTEDGMGNYGYEQVYRFEGTAGMAIRVTLSSENEQYGPNVDVMGPAASETPMMSGMGGGGGSSMLFNVNSTVPGTAIYEVTLPADGVYLFRVHNGISMYGPMPVDGDTAAAPGVGGSYRLLVEVIE